MRDQIAWSALMEIAREYGVDVRETAPGHYQLRGRLIVSYWSRLSKAKVNGTIYTESHVSPYQAVQMTLQLPPVIKRHRRAKRRPKGSYRDIKAKLLVNIPYCRWCGTPLFLAIATIDHEIPLSRGGADDESNLCLSCSDCNNHRGDRMPELQQVA